MKIQINKLYLKYAWKWNITEDSCLICQQDFNSTCSKCKHPIECAPSIGECTHVFHFHCISEWVEKNTQCPICRNVWKNKKILKYEKFE